MEERSGDSKIKLNMHSVKIITLNTMCYAYFFKKRLPGGGERTRVLSISLKVEVCFLV
jgi:hypothetical protein